MTKNTSARELESVIQRLASEYLQAVESMRAWEADQAYAASLVDAAHAFAYALGLVLLTEGRSDQARWKAALLDAQRFETTQMERVVGAPNAEEALNRRAPGAHDDNSSDRIGPS